MASRKMLRRKAQAKKKARIQRELLARKRPEPGVRFAHPDKSQEDQQSPKLRQRQIEVKG